MQQFKVGDWVEVIAGHERPIGSIFKIESCMTRYRASDVALWQPKKDEWCWFWNKETAFGKKETAPAFGRLNKPTNDGWYDAFVRCLNSDGEAIEQLDCFDTCEPLIGELPSFLQN